MTNVEAKRAAQEAFNQTAIDTNREPDRTFVVGSQANGFMAVAGFVRQDGSGPLAKIPVSNDKLTPIKQ